jgi:hypothetical protein
MLQMQQRNMRWGVLPPRAERRLANTTCFDRQRRRLMWRVQWRFAGAGYTATDECGMAIHACCTCMPTGLPQQALSSRRHHHQCAVPCLAEKGQAQNHKVQGSLVCRRLDESTRLADALSAHLKLLSSQAAKQQLLREYLGAGQAQLTLLLRIEHRPVRHPQLLSFLVPIPVEKGVPHCLVELIPMQVPRGAFGRMHVVAWSKVVLVVRGQCGVQADAPAYHRLLPNHTLRLALAQKTVIEFPVITVVLPRELPEYAILKPGVLST